MKENTSYKIVAFLITLILWVIILGTKESVMIKMVDVEFILPKGAVIANDVSRQVAFKAAGPRLILKKFNELKEPMVIDLSAATLGVTTVRLHADSINTPPGVRILNVSPNAVTPLLEPLHSKIVPVVINIKGKLHSGKHLGAMKVEPQETEIRGTKEALARIKNVTTVPIDLDKVEKSSTIEVPLILDEIGLDKPKEESTVKVEMILE